MTCGTYTYASSAAQERFRGRALILMVGPAGAAAAVAGASAAKGAASAAGASAVAAYKQDAETVC